MDSDRYSIFTLLRECLRGHIGWQPAWREPEPKPDYEVLIAGGGGHGLATAHYLASRYGITDVAVLKKGWIDSGNVGRNTKIVRSNYLRLCEGLEQDINYKRNDEPARCAEPVSFRCTTRRHGPARQCDDSARCGRGN